MGKISIILAIFFFILAFFAKKQPVFAFDLFITGIIQQINFVWFDSLMKLITFLGNFYPAFVSTTLIIILLISIKKNNEAFLVFVSTSGVSYLSTLFKNLIARPRPDPDLVIQAGKFYASDSFPSGHVLFAIGLYGFLLYLAYTNLKRGLLRNFVIWILSFVIFLMGLSRIYLGAHWFSDTLGSYLLGIVWLSIIAKLYRRLAPKT